MFPELMVLTTLIVTAPPTSEGALDDVSGDGAVTVAVTPETVAAAPGASRYRDPADTVRAADHHRHAPIRWTLGLLTQLDSRTRLADWTDHGLDLGFRRLRVPLTASLEGRGAIVLTPELRDGRYTTFDAFIDLELSRAMRLRLGKWASPVGYVRLQPGHALFALERGPTSHVAPVREIGLALLGRAGPVEIHAGLFDGAGDSGASDLDDDPCGELAARAAVHLGPLLVGASGSVGCSEGRKPATPRAASGLALVPYAEGTKTAGRTARMGGHLALQGERFFAMAEVLSSTMTLDTPDGRHVYTHLGWQGTIAVALTNDTPHFEGLKPIHPLGPGGEDGAGALEAALTVGGLHPDTALAAHGVDAPDALVLQTSLNWYLDDAFRLQLNWEHTHLGRGRGGDDMIGLRLEARLQGAP